MALQEVHCLHIAYGKAHGPKSIVLAVNGDIKGGSVTVPSEFFDKQSFEVGTLEQCSGTFKIKGHRLLDLFQLMVY